MLVVPLCLEVSRVKGAVILQQSLRPAVICFRTWVHSSLTQEPPCLSSVDPRILQTCMMCTHCWLRLQAVLHTISAALACYVLRLIRQQMHDSECLSLPCTICVYCNSSPCMLAGSVAGTDSGVSESGSRSAVPQGAGPRIYVGGIPNAVSETMVRKYFSNWGKVRPLTGSKQFSQYRSIQFLPVLCSLLGSVWSHKCGVYWVSALA